MKKRILPLLLTLTINAARVRAATNVVTLGSDFQAAINSATDGDTLVVQSGAYGGNLTFNKGLTVVCSGTNGIQFTGNTAVQSAGTNVFVQSQFLGTLQASTNTTVVLSLSGCSGSLTLSGAAFQAYDSQFTGLTGNGGKLTLKRCGISGNITLAGTAFEGLRITNSGAISATAPVGSGTPFVLVQSTMLGLTVTGYRAYLGYNTANAYEIASGIFNFTDCDTRLIGNLILRPGRVEYGPMAAVYVLRGNFEGYNNRLNLNGDNWAQQALQLFGFWIESASADIANNTITIDIYAAYGIYDTEYGVGVTGGGGPVTVRGNAMSFTHANDGGQPVQTVAVYEDGQEITDCSYGCVLANSGPPLIGVAGLFMLFVDPQVNPTYDGSLSPANSWLAPLAGSPCIHAGPPNAIYNNTDGTRNTIGCTGGPFWNPANYTNNDPMVFWLATTNQTVLKGLQSSIRINVGSSAGH